MRSTAATVQRACCVPPVGQDPACFSRRNRETNGFRMYRLCWRRAHWCDTKRTPPRTSTKKTQERVGKLVTGLGAKLTPISTGDQDQLSAYVHLAHRVFGGNQLTSMARSCHGQQSSRLVSRQQRCASGDQCQLVTCAAWFSLQMVGSWNRILSWCAGHPIVVECSLPSSPGLRTQQWDHGLDRIHLQVSQRQHWRTHIDNGSATFDFGRGPHRCRRTGRGDGF